MNEYLARLAGLVSEWAYRWQDEREYEDFNDYIANAKLFTERFGYVFVKLSRRPFKLDFKTDEGEELSLIVKGRHVNLMHPKSFNPRA